jgi:hypothetical protein
MWTIRSYIPMTTYNIQRRQDRARLTPHYRLQSLRCYQQTSHHSYHHRDILLLTPIDPPNLHLYDLHEYFIFSTLLSSNLVQISISKIYAWFTMGFGIYGMGGHLAGVYAAVGCCTERGDTLAYIITILKLELGKASQWKIPQAGFGSLHQRGG